MDPNAARTLMLDRTADTAERITAARALVAWLEAGGFPPALGAGLGGNTAARQWARREALDVLVMLEAAPTADAAADELCTHPYAERTVTRYPAAGRLNVPTGPRRVCTGCGTDFGAAAELRRLSLDLTTSNGPVSVVAVLADRSEGRVPRFAVGPSPLAEDRRRLNADAEQGWHASHAVELLASYDVPRVTAAAVVAALVAALDRIAAELPA